MGNIKSRIIFKTRKNFPETNSSSSHSISISLSNTYCDLESSNLNIDENGVLFIPNHNSDFGWEFKRYNDALTKIQYVTSIPEVKINPKKIKIIKDIIISFTGAKKVIFEWEEQFCKDNSNTDNSEKDKRRDEIIFYGSTIDGNSSEVFSQILESRNTIKDFIFNPNSWLFTGNDNEFPPKDFYNVSGIKSDPEAIVSIDFGGKIGRVDIELEEYPSRYGLSHDIFTNNGGETFNLLNSIEIDITTGEPFTTLTHNYNNDSLKLLRYGRDLSIVNNSIFYVSKKFHDDFFKERRETSEYDPAQPEATLLSLLKKYDNSSGLNYKSFKLSITTKEFGKLL